MAQYELNLRDYLRILRKRKLIVIITFLFLTVASYFYVSSQVPIYEASATVKIMERQSVAGILAEWIFYSPAVVMESETKIIKGFPIVKKVALRLDKIDENTPTSEVHQVVTGLQGQITTETIMRTNIIKITATAGVAKEAMDLANTVAEVYVEENLLEKRRQASATREFIAEQLAKLEARLREGEEQLSQFSSAERDFKLAEPIQNKLVALEFDLVSILQKYTEKHPRVVQLKQQIKDLEAELEAIPGEVLSGEGLEHARLDREVKVNQRLYAMLKEKLEEARITEAQKVSDVSIVDPAVMPNSPIAPQKETAMLVGGFAGLVLGLALAFMMETMDTSIGTIEDVEKLLGLSVLGVIPSVVQASDEEKSLLARFKNRILPTKAKETEESYIRMIVHHKPLSSVSESYRTLRINLNLKPSQKTILITSSEPREGKTTVMVNLGLVLAQKGLKTLLVSTDLRRPALAKTFGIDRKPGLYEVIAGAMKLDEAIKSISDVMLGDIHFEEIIKAPGIQNIWLLTSGSLVSNPAEIFESAHLPSLISELRSRFDIVLFDSPPILPIADASALASKVDLVILCYEIGRTSKSALLRAKSQLDAVGAKIAGVVLNHITPQAAGLEPYPYYSKYKYKYYEKQDKEDTKGKKEKGRRRFL